MHADDEIYWLLGNLPLYLPLFAMVLFRVAGLLVVAPVLGSASVPVRIRSGLAFAMAAVIFPAVLHRLPANVTLATAITGAFGEAAIGLVLGLTLSIMFMGIELAGRIMGQQAGLSLGEVYDPVTNSDSSVIGQVFVLAATVVFVTIGGHRALVSGLLDTYVCIPVMGYSGDPHIVELLVRSMTASFIFALRLAAPVLISLLLVSMVLGFLSRTMPQLNILTVGFALRVLVAFIVAGLTISASRALMVNAMSDAVMRTRDWILAIGT